MKLHLPKRLFTALVSSLVMAAPMAITLASGALVFAAGCAMGVDQQLTENVTWDATNTTTASEDGTIQVGGTDANRNIALTISEGANIKVKWMLLRRGGNVNMTGGQVTLNKLHIHNYNEGGATEVFTLSGGVLEVNAANNFTATGTGDRTPVTIGHWGNGGGKLVVSGGKLQVHNGSIYMGYDSHATLQITAGEANVAGLYYRTDKDTGSRLELSGGRLNIGSEGIRNTEATSSRVVSLTGGTLGALDNWTLSGVTTTIGTIKIDTDKWDAATGTTAVGENIGMNISLLGNITAAEGGMAITLAGSGTLTIDHTLNGAVTLAEGSTATLIADISNLATNYTKVYSGCGSTGSSGFWLGYKILEGESTVTAYDTQGNQLNLEEGVYSVAADGTFYVNDALTYDSTAVTGATALHVSETGIFDLTGATANSVPIINHGQVELTSTGFLNKITNKSTGIVYLNEDEGQQLLKLTGSFEGKTLDTTVDGNVVTSSGGNFNGYLTVLSGTTLKANTVDALGSHDNAITIQKGATLDVNGKSSYNKLILEGGAILANDSENRTGGNTSVLDHRQLDVITLNGDAEIRGKGTFGMVGNSWSVSNLHLNNHTFTKTGTGEFLLVNTNIAAGTILVREGTMTAKSHSTNTVDITAAHVQVESSGTFYQTGSDEQLGSLTLNGGTVKTDANKLTVSGHALLNSGTINANLIVNNATIESAASVSSGKTLTFAENSQLFISEKQVTQSGFVASGLTGTLITGAGTVTLGAGMTASFAGASVSLSQADGALTFTTTTAGTTYVVVTGDTLNATDTVAATSGFTGYYVQEQGILTLTVADGSLSNANAANAITTTRGAGMITVNSEISINQTNIRTVFDGDIQINSGGRLKLGSDTGNGQRDNGTANLAGGVILNGGQLWFHGKTMNLDKLTSINDASVFRVYDMAMNGRKVSVGEMDLQEDLMLLTRPDDEENGWKYTMNVGVLKGSGTLSTHSFERSDLTVNDVTNYTGQINLGNNSTLKLGDGSGTLKVGVNHANAQVQALDGWTGTVFLSGGADNRNVKDLESAANSASKLGFNGLTGWLDNTMNVDIILQNSTGTGDNTALKLNNGSSAAKNTANFAKSVSGSGDMKYMWTDGTIGYVTSHVFSGDTSSWDGWFISGANAGKKVEAVFTAGGNVFDAAGNGGVKDERTSGYHLNVTIDAANDNVTSFNGSIINANQLTVNSDTNFNQNVNTASTILASGVEITLGQKLNETSSNKTTYSLGTLTAAAGGNTINLNNGATLEALTKGNNSGTITLIGSGTHELAAGTTTMTTGISLHDTLWQGAVRISGGSNGTEWGTFSGLYKASSKVALNGVVGHLSHTENITANLILEEGRAIDVQNGTSGGTTTFMGSLEGKGDFQFTGWSTRNNTLTYKFNGNLSDWSGCFINNSGQGYDVELQFLQSGTASEPAEIFAYDSTDTSVGITDNNANKSNLNVTIGDADNTTAVVNFNGIIENTNKLTLYNQATFTRSVSVTAMEVKDKATASLNANSSIGALNAATASITMGQNVILTLGGGSADSRKTHSVGALSAGAGTKISLGDYAILSFANGTETNQKVNTVGSLTTGSGAGISLGDYATLTISTLLPDGNMGSNTGNTNTNSSLELNISGGENTRLNLNLTSYTQWQYNNTVSLSALTEGGKTVDDVYIQSGYLAADVFSGSAKTDLGGATLHLGAKNETSGLLIRGKQNQTINLNTAGIKVHDTATLFLYGNMSAASHTLEDSISGDKLEIINGGGGDSNGGIKLSGSVDLKELSNKAKADVELSGESIKLGSLNVNTSTQAMTTISGNATADSVSVQQGKLSVTADAELNLGDTATITKAEGGNAASMQNVKLSEEGITSADETKATKGSVEDAKMTLAALAEGTSFSIEDVTLSNANIEAANASDRVNLSGLSASDVQLTKGEFHMLAKAQPQQVGTGGSPINLVEGGPTGYQFSTSLLNGMTLGADASMVVDLGDLSGFTGMNSGKPTFSITLEGFRLSDYLSENPGIYFAADSWLGQLLVAQGASDYVKGDSLEVGTQATAGTGSGVSVSYTSTAVGTVIIISGLQVPEPTTSTLGLIALTALVSRRRRK